MPGLTRRSVLAASALTALYGIARPVLGAQSASVPWQILRAASRRLRKQS